MRYLGNKTRILNHIDHLVRIKHLHGGIFADLFSGTGTVSDCFKDRFEIVANDLMTYASVLTSAKIFYSGIPNFTKFIKHYGVSPWTYFNVDVDYKRAKPRFITNHYSPKGHRMYFTVKNALRIDTVRYLLGQMKKHHILSNHEFQYLLACLLENVMTISNTSGTYGAFFKTWQNRAKKTLMMHPLTKEDTKLFKHGRYNKVYTENTNQLVRHISGNVAYIDPPYTARQYSSAYHLLETITLNDDPKIHGKVGNRNDSKVSLYSRRSSVVHAFEDLLRQLKFKHIIISYSDQSLIPITQFVKMIRRFAVNHHVEIYPIKYREYENVTTHYKHKHHNQLHEFLIYFDKDFHNIKSPLDYAGSKNQIMDQITSILPAHVSNFVDMMGGAFNVGSNVVGTNHTFYNEINPFVYQIINMLCTTKPNVLISEINHIIKHYDLSSTSKESYLKLRKHYNQTNSDSRSPLELYVLTLFSFKHMIRFNKHQQFNVPFGNRATIRSIEHHIENYRTKMPIGKLTCGSYSQINYKKFDKDTIFYFDPPYTLSSAPYNDGKRFKAHWTSDDEKHLLNYLDCINKNKQKFIMSNVLVYHNKKDSMLINWLKSRNYNVKHIIKTGRAHPRAEVLIYNY